MEKDSGNKGKDTQADEPEAPSGGKPAGTWRDKLSRLKPAMDFCARNFASALSILAMAISLGSVFYTNHSAKTSQPKLTEAVARIDAMTARIDSYNVEIKKYEAATMASLLKEKALHEEERRKQDELIRQIIHSVSQQQVKMKISPTLEEIVQGGVAGQELQKQQGAASAISSTKTLSMPAGVPPAASSTAKQPAAAPVNSAAKATPAPGVPATKKQPDVVRGSSETKKTTADNSAQSQEELSPQVKAMKEAIEKYNKENR